MMRMVKRRLIEIAIPACGIIAGIAALIDTGKAWPSLFMLTVTMALSYILEAVHKLSDEGDIEP